MCKFNAFLNKDLILDFFKNSILLSKMSCVEADRKVGDVCKSDAIFPISRRLDIHRLLDTFANLPLSEFPVRI